MQSLPDPILVHQSPPKSYPNPPITTNHFESTTEYLIRYIVHKLIGYDPRFLHTDDENVGKFGCEKKLARRLAQFCSIETTLVCGMFGFFDIFGSGLAPIRSSPAVITGTGAQTAG